MKQIDLMVHSAAQICVVPGPGPQRGQALGDLGLIEDGAIAVHGGRIVDVGASATLRARYDAREEIDAGGACVTPGFVDPHTHLPWAGERAAEFEMRVQGASYLEIMKAGGGIMSTVRATREATPDELLSENKPRLQRMLEHGTTSAEAKTGYGLRTDAELKQLDAMRRLNEEQPLELTYTFLPAHAVPEAFQGRTYDYVQQVIDEMLPAGAAWMQAQGVTLFCDVFCEEGVFDLAQTRQILQRAQEMGYRLKVHADEFAALGGAALAVDLGAVSADHLVQTPQGDIRKLGRGQTIAVGLPGTPFGLGHHAYTPAKEILAAGGALALATDLNPGTCWCESMQLILALACRYMGLTQAQALVAGTLNAAHAIGRGHEIGSLEAGKQADILILTESDYRMLGYRFGVNLVQTVIKRGRVVAGVVPA